MEVYEVKVEDYNNFDDSLGLYKELKDAINKAEYYRSDMIKSKNSIESYKEVFDKWHLMEWVAVGEYANHGVIIDKRNVL
tara:strand:- start:589 stop:828 length:240 start_codon:yes stop_codon:yes gene_type:complete